MSRCLVSMIALALAVAAADFSYSAPPIRNYTAWVDTEGKPISCHVGGITRVGDTFFWAWSTEFVGEVWLGKIAEGVI
jgi:hypothetical protein